jgi:hypothetical protein
MLRLGDWLREQRARESLERGGVSPEGVSSPRVRRSLARWGVQPSSEAEFRPRGHLALKRRGVSPEGCRGYLFWWDRTVGPCHWAVIVSGVFYGLWVACVLVFVKENGFPPVF